MSNQNPSKAGTAVFQAIRDSLAPTTKTYMDQVHKAGQDRNVEMVLHVTPAGHWWAKLTNHTNGAEIKTMAISDLMILLRGVHGLIHEMVRELA